MATRYWVGGSGTWDATTTTNWSATSGGSGGASAPTSSDDVVIDSNSGTGSNTITAASGAVCANFTYDTAATIVCSGYISVYGTFAMDAFASAALNTLEVGIYGSTIRGTYNSYVKQIAFLNAGTTTFTGNVAARNVYKNVGSIDMDGHSLYVNQFQATTGAMSNGTLYFSALNSTYYSLNVRCAWSTVTIYMQNGTYTPTLWELGWGSGGSAADLGDIVINVSGTVNVAGSSYYAKNWTINSGALYDTSYSFTYAYGNFYLAAAASITFGGSGARLYIQKVPGSPNVTRTVRIDGELPAPSGISIYEVMIDAGADTINVTGDGNGLGSPARAVNMNVRSATNFSCTTLYVVYFSVTTSVACDISALTSIHATFFLNYSIGLVPGSCAVNITDYTGYGIGIYQSGSVTISSVTIDAVIPVRFSGSNTMGSLTCASSLGDGSGKALEFDPGSTQTVTGAFVLSGASASDTVSLNIYGSGSAATISKASGTVTAAYATISYSNATGGALFKAPLTTNVDGGNNTGWIFTAAGGGANFFNFF